MVHPIDQTTLDLNNLDLDQIDDLDSIESLVTARARALVEFATSPPPDVLKRSQEAAVDLMNRLVHHRSRLIAESRNMHSLHSALSLNAESTSHDDPEISHA